ncbi:MAG: hypothetical protein ACRBF0_15035 [Calditrichia bacterium]
MKLIVLFILLLSGGLALGQPLYLTDYGVITNDSTKADTNGVVLKYVISIANGRVIQLPADTVFIDSININNTNGVRIHGPGVLAFRDSIKTNWNNHLMKFRNCADIELRNFNIDCQMGSGQKITHGPGGPDTTLNGYRNAVVPLYFEGGDTFGENDRVTISHVNFYDSWWIGFGGEQRHGGDYEHVADTVARDVEILYCTWPKVPKRGPAENLGNKAITSAGLIDRIRIEGCDYNGAVDDTIYGNGFYLLPAIVNFTIINNTSRNSYDSDYYSLGFNGLIAGNLSVDAGKDSYKNITLIDAVLKEIPNWPGVGSVEYRNNIARGSGRVVAGSPVGFNIDGELNVIDGNRYEAQDTTGYLAKQGQIAIRINSSNNVVTNNVLFGRNDELPGLPATIAILVTDDIVAEASDRGNSNIIKDNVISGWKDGILIQYDSPNPLITDNVITNIDATAISDYAQNNGRLLISNNTYFDVENVYYETNPAGVDTLLRVHTTILDAVKLDLSPVFVVPDTLIDSLNVRL